MKLQMEFNLIKCEVLHYGSQYKERVSVNGKTVNSIDVHRDLKDKSQLTKVDRPVKKAYGMLDFIVNGMEYKSLMS